MENNKVIWDELKQETRAFLRERYRIMVESGDEIFDHTIKEYEYILGKDNLFSDVKTWEDLILKHPEKNLSQVMETLSIVGDGKIDDKIRTKIIATIKIHELIKTVYGGIVTDEEWADKNLMKFYVYQSNCGIITSHHGTSPDKHFIAFHTYEQCAMFLKYNERLVYDYYQMTLEYESILNDAKVF